MGWFLEFSIDVTLLERRDNGDFVELLELKWD